MIVDAECRGRFTVSEYVTALISFLYCRLLRFSQSLVPPKNMVSKADSCHRALHYTKLQSLIVVHSILISSLSPTSRRIVSFHAVPQSLLSSRSRYWFRDQDQAWPKPRVLSHRLSCTCVRLSHSIDGSSIPSLFLFHPYLEKVGCF